MLALSAYECQTFFGAIPMPTYEYRCKDCSHELEAVQSFHDNPLTECPSCGGPLRKKYGAVGISFRGEGFYKTDSRSKTKKAEPSTSAKSEGASSEGSGSSSADKSGSSSDSASSSSSTSGKAETKSSGESAKKAPKAATPA